MHNTIKFDSHAYIMHAEKPAAPNNIRIKNRMQSEDCGTSHHLTWDPPDNIDETAFDHYEFTLSGFSNVIDSRINSVSYNYRNLVPHKAYTFTVYAVDKCGRKGLDAHKRFVPDTCTGSEDCDTSIL